MTMEDGDWGALAFELVQQNYAFVAAFSVMSWDCLITFHQEVKYIWGCSSNATKYLFLVSRYYAMGYFITWLFIHVSSFSFLIKGSQIILVSKVYNLYNKSVLLASGLVALHCAASAGASSLITNPRLFDSLGVDPICNGRHVPITVLSLIAFITCNLCITCALILRKVRPRLFLRWRRYLLPSNAHTSAGMSLPWGLCLIATLLGTLHSFVIQRIVPVYVFTIPTTVISIGTCRYILWIEKDRTTQAKIARAIETSESERGRVFGEEQSHGDVPPMQNRHQHSYPSRSPTLPSPLDSKASSTPYPSSELGRHNFDTVVANFAYLPGAQSYIWKLKSSRHSMVTVITNSTTNHSPRSSSDYGSRRAAGLRSSWDSRASSGSSLRANCSVESETTFTADQHDVVEQTPSSSNIEIGSLQSSSSVNSEELRRFYNNMWNVGPFMADGP